MRRGWGQWEGGRISRARARVSNTVGKCSVRGSTARVEGIGPRAGSTRTLALLFEPIAISRAVTGSPAVARRPAHERGLRGVV